MNEFKKNIKQLRRQYKLRQQDVAHMVGISLTMWSNYEIGNSEPRLSTLLRIAKVFKVTLDELVTAKNIAR